MKILFHASQTTVSFPRIRTDRQPTGLTDYELAAWQFCHDWLLGKEKFTLHTSGSTGIPKPITLSRQQMAASAAMTGRALQLRSGNSALVNLNVQYIAGIMMLVRGLELGLALTIIEPTSNPLAHFAGPIRFDLQSYVPLQLQAILEKTPEKISVLNTAQAILVGGAPVSPALAETLQQVTAPIYQTYGMTETVSHIALRRVNGPERQDFYVALDTVSLQTDERNCLVIQAPQLSRDAVVTNDVVELLSSTAFRWVGRADNVINSGGVKVQAEKVEQKVGKILAESQLSCRFFVAGLAHPQLGEAVTLVIEGNPLPVSLENSILQKLKTGLARYELPKEIRYVRQFAETPTSKIDRKKTLETL